eukprot:Seg1805.1 transcript_id=Seg1805.1/GoldUCD/mRNA.D3Y31 product="hypothetical protein" protein_id=Seg1805.1/GoldUCD/D3Y31
MIGNKSKVSQRKSSSEIQSKSQDIASHEKLVQLPQIPSVKVILRKQDSSGVSVTLSSFEEQTTGYHRPSKHSQNEEVVARDDERCEVSNQRRITVSTATPSSQHCRAYPVENKYQNLLPDEKQRGQWKSGNCVRIADVSSCLNGQSKDRDVRTKMDCRSQVKIGQQEGNIVPQDMLCYQDIQNLKDSLRARKESSPAANSVDYRDLPKLIPVLTTHNDPGSQAEAVNVCAACGNRFNHIGFAMYLQEARNAGRIPNNRVSHGSGHENIRAGQCGSCYVYYSWLYERLHTMRSDVSPGSLSPDTVRYQDASTVCPDQHQTESDGDTNNVHLSGNRVSTFTSNTKIKSSNPDIDAHPISSSNLLVDSSEIKLNMRGTKRDPCGMPPAKRLKSNDEGYDISIAENKADVKEVEEKNRKRSQYIVSAETRARLQSAINQTAATRGFLHLAAGKERPCKTDVRKDSSTIDVVKLDDSKDDPDRNFFEDINRIMNEHSGDDDKGDCFAVSTENKDRPSFSDSENGMESKGTNESKDVYIVAERRENMTLNSVRLREDAADEISKKSGAEPLAVYIPPSQMIKVLGLKPGEAMDVTYCMGLDSLKKLSLMMTGKESFVADPYKGSDRRKQDFEKIIEIITNMYGKGNGLTGEETKALMKTEAFLKEYFVAQDGLNQGQDGNKSIKKEQCSPDDRGINVAKNFRNRGIGTIDDPVIIIDETACPDEIPTSSFSVEVSLIRPLKRMRYASDISLPRLTNIKKEEPSSDDVEPMESPTDGQIESTMGHTASDQKGNERFGNKGNERLQSDPHAQAYNQVYHAESYGGEFLFDVNYKSIYFLFRV